MTPDHVRTLARYNAWQNAQLIDIFATAGAGDLCADRGAFFGSILGTANHVLWADQMWMSRFADVAPPSVPLPDSPRLTANAEGWGGRRRDLDARILDWAAALTHSDLDRDLVWFSGSAQSDIRRAMAICVTHMFNHQTHHRGQIHAMLTSAGLAAPVSDLVFMPDLETRTEENG
ncbi:DinB family protein [Sagittula sp. SSi028]|uniref:DinB family protein n=1 Tax=Sagittula sp. SSi028 TaxID=3400636 RepID=UPI003AF92CFE